jgi:hypothetical protein
MTTIELPFPLGGVNKNQALSEQPPLTSRDCSNVLPFDRTTGRLRGATRPGMSAYFTGYLSGQGNKVQALAGLAYQARHVSYSADSIPNELWSAHFTGDPTISCITAGLYDDFFAVQGNTDLLHMSRYGVEMGRVTLDGANSDMQVNALHVDQDGGIYVATTTWVTNFSSVASYRFLWKYQLAADNKAMEFLWSLQPGTSSTIAGMYAVGDSLFTLESTNASSTTSAVQLVEYQDVNTYSGANTTGSRQVLNTITGTDINSAESGVKVYPTGGGNTWAHDFHARTVGQTSFVCAVGTVRDGSAGSWAQFKLMVTSAPAYGLQSNYLFVNDETSAVDSFHGGGIGFAIRIDSTGNVFSLGRRNPGDRNNSLAATSGNWLRKLVDTGTAWSETQGWVRTTTTDLGAAGTNPGYGLSRIAIDKYSNLVAPTSVNSTSVAAAKVVKGTGVLFTSIVQYVYVAGVPTITSNECRAVAIPTSYPLYQEDDYKITDTVFLAGTAVATLTSNASELGSMQGYDILLETANNVSSRSICCLGVSAGNIVRFTSSGTTNPTNETGRSPVLSATGRLVQWCGLSGEFFFTDGSDYAVVRPLPTIASPNGEIGNWNASSLGIIPPRCRLIARWRNRIVLAHSADSPFAWHMSAFGDAYDWDLFPPEPLETQAVSGTAVGGAGNTPQIITALCPWSDDLLFIGCDAMILRMDGDPMAGGRMSVVSDQTGMAFGTPWCKDPEGRIYFFGSRGGIYVMSPTGEIAWLTRDTIEEDLANIDLSVNRVELCWNNRDNGLHVFIFPFDAGGTHLTHYFWSQRTQGWFPMEFGTSATTDIQPTAVCVIDGDLPQDRVMLLGTEDGRVLKWDADASSDDGEPIDSKVLYGPYSVQEEGFEAKIDRLSVILASELGGCHAKLFCSDTAETPLLPRSEIRVAPGRNVNLPVAARGSWLWFQMRSASRTSSGVSALGEKWAVESVRANIRRGGRARCRS